MKWVTAFGRGLLPLLLTAIGGCNLAHLGFVQSGDTSTPTAATQPQLTPSQALPTASEEAQPEPLPAAVDQPTLTTMVETPENQPAEPALPEEPANLWVRIRSGFSLPTETERRQVRSELDWFSSKEKYIDHVTERASPYLYFIVQELEQRNMPMELALLPVVESAFQPFAYSPGRAAGIWQFIPGTGRRYGLKQDWWYDGRRDIVASTRAALNYLQDLHKEFDGDWLHALAAYNCGEGNVRKAIRRNRKAGKPTAFWNLKLPRETRSYVPRLLALSEVVSAPERYGITLQPIENQPQFTQVALDQQLDLALAAEMAEISMEELYRLNPGFNRWATPTNGPHNLLLPTEKATTFLSRLNNLPAEKRMRWERHRIRKGETLGQIAMRYRTTVKVLQQVNRIRGSRIRAGRSLTVPVAVKSLESYSLSADARRNATLEQSGKRARAIHTVRSGESLWSIAQLYGVRVRSLAKWNAMAPRDLLSIGRKLVIRGKAKPAATGLALNNRGLALTGETTRRIRYTVRRGESLWHISRRFNVSIDSLRKWNSLHGKKYLQPGQKLHVYVDLIRQNENI